MDLITNYDNVSTKVGETSPRGSKFQNFPKRGLNDKIFNFKGRATILIPSCLFCQGASNHV